MIADPTSATVQVLPPVLTLRELATVIRLCERTIRLKLAAGTFPIPPLDDDVRRWRFAGADVARYLNRSARMPRSHMNTICVSRGADATQKDLAS